MFEPVAFDVSIFPQPRGFILRVREDAELTLFRTDTLEQAQRIAGYAEPGTDYTGLVNGV